MGNSLLKTIIRRKVLVSMLFIGITFMGYISYTKLAVELFPNVELPVLIVHVRSATDVDPKHMERQAIIPLESTISTLEGVAEITSNANSREGLIFISMTTTLLSTSMPIASDIPMSVRLLIEMSYA